MKKLADLCETDEDCRKRDVALLEQLKAITEITGTSSYDLANLAIYAVMDVYGGTLREGHLLFADFDRVGTLIHTWEEENIKFE